MFCKDSVCVEYVLLYGIDLVDCFLAMHRTTLSTN